MLDEGSGRPAGLPRIDLARASLFLDFDGTLVEIADRPDGIEVPAGLAALLRRLEAAAGGRLVMVTGRPVADLARHLDWAGLHIVGSHGAETRRGGAHRPHPRAGSEVVRQIQGRVRASAAAVPGLLVEEKPAGVVLHYRADPAAEPQAHRIINALARTHAGFELHESKMAYELRPDDASKEAAISALMAEPGFAGTLPVFIGDDVTDEPALAWVAGSGGLAIKVGAGDSAAPHRLAAPSDVHALLAAWAAEAGV